MKTQIVHVLHSKVFFKSAKITSDMNKHTVIYLDTNYLSNMAKAQLGSITDQVECKFWLSLLEELKDKVLSDAIACPEFPFQRDEAEFDKRIEYAVWQVICELSLGLEFLPWETILELEVEDVAFKFLGKNPPRRRSWQSAFKSNPQDSVESRMTCNAFGIKHRIEVFISPPKEAVDHDRQLKRRWEDTARSLLKQPTFGDWHKELLVQKSAFIDRLLGPSVFNMIAKQEASDNLLDKLVAVRNMSKLKERLTRLGEIGITVHNMTDFFNSGELLNAPFIDVFCSINTVIVQNYTNREPKGGDLRDAAILATVLPYCDVVTTDRFMKYILVNHPSFDNKYKCKIFSASKADRLAFKELVRELK